MEEPISLVTGAEEVRPMKAERFMVKSTIQDQADILIMQKGQVVRTIEQNKSIKNSAFKVVFDGLDEEQNPLPQGAYDLVVKTISNGTFSFPIQVGAHSPTLVNLSFDHEVRQGKDLQLSLTPNRKGKLLIQIEVKNIWEKLYEQEIDEKEIHLVLPLLMYGHALETNMYSLRFVLEDEKGKGAPVYREIFVYKDEKELEQFKNEQAEKLKKEQEEKLKEEARKNYEHKQETYSKPSHVIIPSKETTKEQETNYWTMTLGDLTDEQAIWDIMMQDMVVLDEQGKKSNQTYKLRLTPDKSTARENVVGEISYLSQGVHVIETLDNGFTKVEVYNTSYGDDNVSNSRGRGYGTTAELITGYVETSALKTVKPNEKYALLIDKFKQKMYIFEDGKIIGTLLVSTGKNTKTQSWNETPAGEFFMISKTGGFYAGNLWCDMGMRINGGCLVHEVPSVINEETEEEYFGYTEPALGQKASHGCVRVQRKPNEEGQNMQWLWNNIKLYTKVIIWEDSVQYYDYPSAYYPLYYNKDGGKYYHNDQNCYSVSDKYLPLSDIMYEDLEKKFEKLTPCPYCNPPIRPEDIREKNLQNGFEHGEK